MNLLGNLAKNLSMNRGRREPSSSLALGKKATFRAPPLSVSSFARIKKRFQNSELYCLDYIPPL